MLVFAFAAALTFWVLLGYPILLAVLSRYASRPICREPIEPTVSIIVAVYNGELYLENKLRSLLELDYPRSQVEIFVASDGSSDRTEEIARSFAAQGVQLLSLPRGGKPAALNATIPHASGEILLLTDVRQTLAPDSLTHLARCFADPSVGVVSGELRIRSGATQAEADIGLYWRFESWIRDRLSMIDSMFGATGPFYAIRRSLAVPIPPDMLLDDVYLPLAAFFRGYRLVMESRARAYDFPTSLHTEFRRKVRTLAGNYQILMAYPALLGPGNRMWIHFVSYKLGRLLLPWFLIALAISSFWLPDPWRWLVLAGQAALYGLAALDNLIPAKTPLKRISSPARTFAVMMIAAVWALSILFVPARSLWHVTSATPNTPVSK
jgi:cellulose synthase/poly-beta-1,6-N-acetylglucosamine synthase-like glycosyltransferase